MSVVYVLDKNGSPLMPTCRCGKVYRLLKTSKAKVVKREPFTIKLLYEPETHIVQELNLGIDVGSSHIGSAVVDNQERVLYLGEVEIRNDIKNKMDARRSSRRNRRNRKTRYRKARFLNRANSTKKDRLQPTLRSKIDSHVREIEFVKSILPIKNLICEIGHFDPHLIKEGKDVDYRHGTLFGWENVKTYVRSRDNYICQYCGKKTGKMEVHHIVWRKNGGSDEPENLITLCHECHWKTHNEGLEIKRKGKYKSTLNHATHMNIISSYLLKLYPEMETTYGYITKSIREDGPLGKEHYYDAVVIAGGVSDFEFLTDVIFKKKHIARGDYQRSKGLRSEKIIPQGKIQGFLKFDKVEYLGKKYFIKGRRSAGNTVLMHLDGNSVDLRAFGGKQNPPMRDLKRVNARSTTLIEKENIALLVSAKE